MADQHVPADDDSRSDLDSIQSLADFAQSCARLRAGRSYAELRKAARPQALPAATLSDLLNARTTPTRETVRTFLYACGLHDDAAQRPWLAVWKRVATAHQPRPAGAERVRQARPRLLGVHAAIQIPSAAGELPPYVPRDLDSDLRAALTAAAAQGGFVLLVGGSSVGKTRALYEAVQAHLPEWWLLHPADTPAIADHAAAAAPRTMLWLDELQRYLNHPTGLPASTVRQLITAGTVVVATLWPDEYSMRTTRPSADQPDPYANDRDLLRLAHTIRVPDTLSPAERRRGETLAPTDQRIRIALDATDAGFTQVLAAGPTLIQHWEQATNCYGKAIITAALDARRVGAHHPATRDFLEAATPGYLTPAQQATAPPDWLDRGLTYATTAVQGAAACLTPVPGSMGHITGYTTADYLHQHSQHARRTTAPPDSAWNALIIHHHPDDTLSLADNASRRGQSPHAIRFYSFASAAGHKDAANPLAYLLAEQGRVEELRTRADAGDWDAADRLAYLLAKQDRVEELRTRADAGDWHARLRLADLLSQQGRVEELRIHADAGVWAATDRLTSLLVQQGRVDDALQLLRTRVDAGDLPAADELAGLLVQQGRVEELRARTDIRNVPAANRLARLLIRQGHVDEALQLLCALADTGDWDAANQLADLLMQQGRIDDALQLLRARVETGDWGAANQLADLLAQQGRIDDALELLRPRANIGGFSSAVQSAVDHLAKLLIQHGRVDEALEVLRARAGIGSAASQLADLLVQHGRVDELRARAETGDYSAANRLADLLTQQGRIDEALELLRALADTGDGSGAAELAELLAKHGRVEELRVRADTGDLSAARRLVNLLATQRCVDGLRDEVAAGTSGAAAALHRLLRN